jgi:hypothetical protein
LKFLLKALLFIIAAILAGLLVAQPAIANSPTIESSVINPPYGPKTTELRPVLEKKPIRSNDKQLVRPDTTKSYADLYGGRVYSKEEVQELIKDYSLRYGISAELPLRIAHCESGFNQYSKNRSSSASGTFQYLASTWGNTEAGRSGISVFDADANVRMAVQHIASKGTSPWASSKSCWNQLNH